MATTFRLQRTATSAGRPSAALTEAGGSRRELGWIVAAAVTAGLGCLVRYGYRFGDGDQALLSLKGISLADSSAFRNDWFTRHAPQPHWLFDGITFVGERLGALPLVYFAYWALALLAFGTAATWLGRRFFPSRRWPILIFGPVMAVGPEKVLGSTTPLLGVAVPHVLGGCLALLTLAALLTERWRSAVFAAVLTWLVHVQHGANLAPILVLAAVLATGASRRSRLTMAGTGLLLGLGAALVLNWRGIHSGSDEWLEICVQASPFHCDANSWPVVYLVGGFLLTVVALGWAVAHRRLWRSVVPAVVLPGGGLLAAVLVDRLDVPVLGELAQRSNAYRLAALVLPLAALALLSLVARVHATRQPADVATLAILAAFWLTPLDHDSGGGWRATPVGLAVLFALLSAIIVLALRVLPPARDLASRHLARRTNAPVWAFFLLPGALFLAGAVLANGGFSPVHLGYNRGDPRIAAALELGERLPERAVVAAHPAIDWLRAVSRRAVVADCKAIPYGGRLWREYLARMAALGGTDCTLGPGAFATLTPADVEGLAGAYGVTHVLLFPSDPKLVYATQHWRLVWRMGPRDHPLLANGWMVFKLPSRAA